MPLPPPEKATNRLAGETSPYLLQHADNPVDWWPWCPQALAVAKEQNKPILLSVGYSACHWCHVMAHESFETEDTAAVMNALFVNIKVDREERPDIDAIYQQALQMIGEQGGWPLTMFLTPDAEPFWGGTYFPDTARYGRPSFNDVLRRIADLFAEKSETIESNRSRLRAALEASHARDMSGALPENILALAAERLVTLMDPVHGGVQGAPKFPQPSILNLLWRGHCASGSKQYKDAVLLALERMSMGGIYDHLGGGYSRYSTDEVWLAPHFEKMLYDNAQLIDLLTLAWQETGNILYKQRARETIAWLKREMTMEGGAFASALDADSEGVEGKFYVWDMAEITALLGDDAAFFSSVYDVAPGGNWEGKCILNRSAVRPGMQGGKADLLDQEGEARLEASREILLAARAKRVRPGRDDKILADWNGMMIAALANAGAVFAEPDWIAMAGRAFDFIRENMTAGDGRLCHSYCGGRAGHAALLDDYAQMARAGLFLYEITGNEDILSESMSWSAQLNENFWSETLGGFHMAGDSVEDGADEGAGGLLLRPRSAHDGPSPSGNAVAAEVFARLYALTGDPAHEARAGAIINAFAGDAGENIFALAGLINANDFMRNALQIVVMGRRGDQATDAALAAICSTNLPNRVIQVVDDGAEFPASHPARGKSGAPGVAYICRGQQCSLPIDSLENPESLRQTLIESCRTRLD